MGSMSLSILHLFRYTWIYLYLCTVYSLYINSIIQCIYIWLYISYLLYAFDYRVSIEFDWICTFVRKSLLFIFIQLMASCLVSLSIDLAWEGRSVTSWIVLNSNYVICLTFRLRLGLQPSQVVDSTDYRKDCEEFYEPLGFFTYHHSDVCVYGLSFILQSRSEKHWVEDCEGSITCRTLSSGEDHELGRGIPWHLEMMDTWQDHGWTRLPFWRSNGLVIEIRHLHIMAPSYMMIPDSVFT